jgi:hypothetical protein
VTQPLDAASTRLVAILTQGRGADGSLGAEAQTCSIPADRFRLSQSNAPLRDGSQNRGALDRAIRLEWSSIEDAGAPDNELDSVQLRWLHLSLQVAYVQAQGDVAAFAKTIGSETAAAVIQDARKRALSDAERIRKAVTSPFLFPYGSTDPVLLSCDREAPTTLEDLGDGIVIATTPYRVLYQANSGTTYDP